MGRKITTLLFLLALLLPLAGLTGCGDSNVLKSLGSDSNSDTKMEEGIAALDAGDFDTAVAKLSSLSDSDDKRKYLASAYLGLAGFDTLDLIAAIDDARDENDSGPSIFWDAAGTIFEDDAFIDGLLDLVTIAEKKAYVEQAMGVLLYGDEDYFLAAGKTFAREGLLGDMDKLTDARAFQTGIAALCHALLSVSEELQVDTNGVINPAAYLGSLPAITEVPPGLEDDLTVLLEALDRSAAEGSLLDDLNQLLVDIGYADDHVVTQNELETFLANLNQSNF